MILRSIIALHTPLKFTSGKVATAKPANRIIHDLDAAEKILAIILVIT